MLGRLAVVVAVLTSQLAVARADDDVEPAAPPAAGAITGVSVVDAHRGHEDKKHGKGDIRYKPGKGFYLRAHGAVLRIRTIVEPVIRFSNLDCGPAIATCPDPQVNMTIRRGRLGFKASVPHDLGLDVEVQIKNLLFGITHFYGMWTPTKDFELQVGFIKPPGNIERKVTTWQTPWAERGVVSAWISIARVMGFLATGTTADRQVFWQVAVSKPVKRGLDGAESEDQPPPRPGALDPDDLIKGAGQMNLDGRLEWDPSDDLELGIAGGIRFRDDGDTGDNAPEPYDSPIAIAHQYKGMMVHGVADAVVRHHHWRLIAEIGARRDGTSADLNDDGSLSVGRLSGIVGDVTVGFTPNGRYAAAHDYAELEHGWELLARFNGARIVQPGNEPVGLGGVARYWGVETGVAVHVAKQLKVQLDGTYEWFGSNAYGANAGARRIWAQAWAVWSL